MNEYNFKIIAYNQPTVLERILQVTRYRGFNLVAIVAEPIEKVDQLNISLTVSSHSGSENLQSQLNKLIDVKMVEVQSALNQQCMA